MATRSYVNTILTEITIKIKPVKSIIFLNIKQRFYMS